MDNRWKHILGTKRAFIAIGLLVLVCAAGMVLMARRLQAGNLLPGSTSSIPVAADENLPQSPGGETDNQDDKYSIRIKLSDGQSQPQTVEVLRLATGRPLSSEEIEAILSRLPERPVDPSEQTEFNVPSELLPTPRPGNTIKETFPPLETEPTRGGTVY